MSEMFLMKGIELPPDNGRGSGGPTTQYPFETMQVGEAFFLPKRKSSKFSPYAGKFARRFKTKYQCRDVHMAPEMRGEKQVGWKLSSAADGNAVAGCVVKRVEDPSPEELAQRETDFANRKPRASKGQQGTAGTAAAGTMTEGTAAMPPEPEPQPEPQPEPKPETPVPAAAHAKGGHKGK